MSEQLELENPPVHRGDAFVGLQRAALRELVELSSDCAVRERELEQNRQSATAAVEKAARDGQREIDNQRERSLNAFQQQFDKRFKETENRYGASLARLKGSGETLRKQTEHDTAAVEHDLKQQLQHTVWLADSLLEGAVAAARQEHRKVVENVTAQLDAMEAMDQRTVELMLRYRQVPPTSIPQPDAPPPEPRKAGDELEACQREMEQKLARMQTLFVPRMFVEWRPFAIVIGFCILVAIVAQGFAGGLPPRAEMGIQWAKVGIAAGAALMVVLAAGAALWMLAKAQARAAYISIQQTLLLARQAAEQHQKESAEARQKRVAHAKHNRDREVAIADDSVSPRLENLAQKRQDALNTADAEHLRQLNQAREEYEGAHADLKRWQLASQQEIQRKHQEDTRRLADEKAEGLRELARAFDRDHAQLHQQWTEGLKQIQSGIDGGKATNGQAPHDWNAASWKGWTPPTKFTSQVRFGEMHVDVKQVLDSVEGIERLKLPLPGSFAVPALLAFPKQASLLIQTDVDGRSQGMRVLQMVMARLLTVVPAGRVRFTIIDPVGLGQNFAGFMHLADHDEALVGSRIWTDAEHIDQRLKDLTEHMETVIQKYLRNEYETIDDYNAQAGELAEPYRFLVVADFPTNFSQDAIRRLNSIASAGARCGVYTLVLRDTRQALSGGSHIDELERNSVNLVRDGNRFVWKDDVLGRFPLTLDEPPEESVLTRILDAVGRGAKEAKRVELDFTTIAPRDDQFWTSDCTDELRIPIGRAGATRQQFLRLGRGVAQHALIAGKTGSGKSTLLHVLVTNLASWYPPDEVEFYLVDFKKGVEFKTYATHILPHARAIAVESDREFGISVLHRVDAEMTRRGTLFRDAGVQDITSYRRMKEGSGARGQGTENANAGAGSSSSLTPDPSPLTPLPRVLLIIDEFQEFFSEDDKLSQDASLLLDRLVRQGRAFGIHLLLGSQTIGGSSGLARSTIGQMAVRIALQTSEADSQLILADNNSAARLLSRPGEAIYNDAGGLIEANSPFQVAWLPDDRREKYLQQVRDKAASEKVHAPLPVVFEGNVMADIRGNRRLAELITHPDQRKTAPTAPRAWVGEPVAIKEPTGIILRRQSGANLLMIGQQETASVGIMASTIISLAAQHPRGTAAFYLMDGTPADSPFAGVLKRIGKALPHPFKPIEWRAVPEAINEIAAEVARRQETGGIDAPAIFLVIHGLQRYRPLRKQDEGFNFSMSDEEKKPSPDKQFADILREGASLGVHVLTWADTLASIERTLDRGAMREFDHRVLFQMSANDSSNLIDSPAANKLGFHRAVAYSEEQGVMEKFRPYALPEAGWLEEVRTALLK